jgi:hypothetical protein
MLNTTTQSTARWERPIRFLVGLAGAILGAIFGGAAAVLFSILASGGNALAVGFFLVLAGPPGLLLGAVLGIVLALRVLRYLRATEASGVTLRKKRVLAMSLALGYPALVVGMLWAAINHDNPPPDEVLLANFHRHEATLDQVVRMVQVDKGLTRVDDNWTMPAKPQTIGVSLARIAEYRRLLTRAGVPRGFQASDNVYEIRFLYYVFGSAISSDRIKGYAYLTKPPLRLLPNLNPCDRERMVYRHIHGNWYLFYQYIPG